MPTDVVVSPGVAGSSATPELHVQSPLDPHNGAEEVAKDDIEIVLEATPRQRCQ